MSGSCLPPTVPQPRRPLPSPGSSCGEFPWLTGTMRHSDFRTPLPRHLTTRHGTTPLACVRLSQPTRRRSAGLELCGLAAPRQLLSRWRRRTSHVAGESSGAYALFFDPGRTGRIRPLRCASAAPDMGITKAPTSRDISGLGRTASAHAVYASPNGLPTPDARLASAAGQALRSGTFTRRIPLERFPRCLLHRLLLSQPSHGASRVGPALAAGPPTDPYVPN
jgi:hypothetical protein